ncbi:MULTISPECIES: 4Fe-4S binding protein [unclassified Fusibacter]|uniref:4Fe-4S binding protein n=1 Tax=unclassified Fusibacter TaxID=2624464 RepID=UPI001013A372|nr:MULTISPECIES: 4Fe-4S binding protein [unclassified Fusibacter]MCK8058936.1 4Fe-4S binding protein [Fusibacter sp. A2]NPE22012.1 4Fe-4S binding protein [Fusibacter sp. A1]RXV61577.1 4Fe-4S dicluster domain-containing protein [Fusibacter sp. A1]
MAHLTGRTGYKELIDRYNRFPQGAPEAEVLYEILKVMFTHEEASLVSLLPIKPFSVKNAAKIWKMTEEETFKILEGLAEKALLLDMNDTKEQKYVVPPPMIGFFEFALMRTGGHFDQKLLSELFHQYLETEEDFMRKLLSLKTPIGRILVNENTVKPSDEVYVLDYERATKIIENAESVGVSRCYCRHKAEHLGENCDAPQEVCLSINGLSHSLSKHGYSKLISKEKAFEILKVSYDNNLIQFAENVKEGVGFICNCCSCCCMALKGAKKMGIPQAISSSNFIAAMNDKCVSCKKCIAVCPVGCFTKNDDGKVSFDDELCLGCGVCQRVCKLDAIEMKPREIRIFTPVNTVHKLVLEAIETDTLHNLIFDNQAMTSHKFMAAFTGAFLKLPPVKQLLVSEKFQSKYLLRLIEKVDV